MLLSKATLPQKDYDEFVAELTSKIKEVQKLKIEDLQYPKNLTRRKDKVTNTKGAWNNNSNAKKILLEELSFNASVETDYNFNDYKMNTQNILNLSGDWAAEGDKKIAAQLKIELIEAIDEFNNIMAQIIPIEVEKFIELTKEELSKLKVGELSTDAKNPKKKEILETKPSVNKTIGEYLFPKDIKQIIQMLSSVESAKQLRDYLNKIGKPEIENFSVEMPETTEEGDWAEGVTVEDIKEYNNRVKTSAGRNSVRSYALEQANNKFNLIEDESVKSKLEEILGLSVEMQSLRDKKSLKVRSATITALGTLLKRIEKYVSKLKSGKPSDLNALLGRDTKTRKNTIGYLKNLNRNKLEVTRWDFKKGKWDNFKPYNIKEGEESGATKYSKSYLRYEELESLGEKINTILKGRIDGTAIDESQYSQIADNNLKIKELLRKETRIKNIIDTLEGQLEDPQYSNNKMMLGKFKTLIDKNKKELKSFDEEYTKYVKELEEQDKKIGGLTNESVLDVIEEDLQTTTDTILLSKEKQKLFIKNRKTLEDFIMNKFGETGPEDMRPFIDDPKTETKEELEEREKQQKIDQKKIRLQGFEGKNRVLEMKNEKIERENQARKKTNKENRIHNKKVAADPDQDKRLKEINTRTMRSMLSPFNIPTVEEREEEWQREDEKIKQSRDEDGNIKEGLEERREQLRILREGSEEE